MEGFPNLPQCSSPAQAVPSNFRSGFLAYLASPALSVTLVFCSSFSLHLSHQSSVQTQRTTLKTRAKVISSRRALRVTSSDWFTTSKSTALIQLALFVRNRTAVSLGESREYSSVQQPILYWALHENCEPHTTSLWSKKSRTHCTISCLLSAFLCLLSWQYAEMFGLTSRAALGGAWASLHRLPLSDKRAKSNHR